LQDKLGELKLNIIELRDELRDLRIEYNHTVDNEEKEAILAVKESITNKKALIAPIFEELKALDPAYILETYNLIPDAVRRKTSLEDVYNELHYRVEFENDGENVETPGTTEEESISKSAEGYFDEEVDDDDEEEGKYYTRNNYRKNSASRI